MKAWVDVLIIIFLFLLEFLCVSFLSLFLPLFHYVNVLLPGGMFFLYTGERFAFRLSLLLGGAFLLEVLSFSPFGLWLFRVSFLLGIALLWIEVFSRGTVSLAVFFALYPFLEFLLERFVVLPVTGSGSFAVPWVLLGKAVSVFLGLFLFFAWLRWGKYHVE
ncbi:MAG: hypothetical protein H5U36_01070 [Candidatus Caldatribacterium sp.]|nr:hypothetical protein [Candidatus Caldatribacterium sp.]